MTWQSPLTPRLALAKALIVLSGSALAWVIQRTAGAVDAAYGCIASIAILGLLAGDLLRTKSVVETQRRERGGRMGFRTEELMARHRDARPAHAGGRRGTEAFRNE